MISSLPEQLPIVGGKCTMSPCNQLQESIPPELLLFLVSRFSIILFFGFLQYLILPTSDPSPPYANPESCPSTMTSIHTAMDVWPSLPLHLTFYRSPDLTLNSPCDRSRLREFLLLSHRTEGSGCEGHKW